MKAIQGSGDWHHGGTPVEMLNDLADFLDNLDELGKLLRVSMPDSPDHPLNGKTMYEVFNPADDAPETMQSDLRLLAEWLAQNLDSALSIPSSDSGRRSQS